MRLVRAALALAPLLGCTPAAGDAPEVAAPKGAPPAVESSPSVSAGGKACPEVVDFDAHLQALAVPAADVAKVRRGLGKERTDFTRSPWEQHAEALSGTMDDPLPALAHLLPDYDLGDTVASTMFEIDRDRAAPLVFASMPRSDRNVQYHSFKLFLRLTFEGEALCWDAVVRDGARRTLEEGTNADAAEQALLALGVTGTTDDTALLQRYVASDEPVPMWRKRLRDAAQAALARLGDGPALAAIRAELDIPVPRRVGFDQAIDLSASLFKAGFSKQRELVPLLCRHLDTPSAKPNGDALPPQPSRRAAMALGHVVDGKAPDDLHADVDAWKKRCLSGTL